MFVVVLAMAAAWRLAGPEFGPALMVALAGVIVTLAMFDREKAQKAAAALERELGYVRRSRISIEDIIADSRREAPRSDQRAQPKADPK